MTRASVRSLKSECGRFSQAFCMLLLILGVSIMFTSTITSILFAVMLVPGSNGLDGVGVLEPTCCAKHAYCCQVQRECCRTSPAVVDDTSVTNNVGRPTCCAKHAYCCTVKRACCGKAEQAVVVELALAAPQPTCCAKRAYCCSTRAACCGKASREFAA